MAERLLPVGYTLTDDGGEVRLWPLPGRPGEVVACLTTTEATVQPSAEQAAILGIVAYFGPVTRTEVEAFRGDRESTDGGERTVVDSASLLDRMVRQGLLAKARSDRALGAPYVYSITTKALRAAGYPTVEVMREVIAAGFAAEHLATIRNRFEKDRKRLTRGLRTGRRDADAAPKLPGDVEPGPSSIAVRV